MKPIDICRNKELIKDINEVFAKHGLQFLDTFITIESPVSCDLNQRILGHKIIIQSYLLNILDSEEDDNEKNKFKGKEIPYSWDMLNDDMVIIPYEKFMEIMLSRNVETNNPKLHNRITSVCNPNREHWLKKFMDLYLKNNDNRNKVQHRR